MGRKKKEEKKSYLYLNVSSIVFIFGGLLVVIAFLQGQDTYLKQFLTSNFGISSIALGFLLSALGLYLSPLIKIKVVNKSFVAGAFFTFLSFLLFDNFRDPSFIAEIFGGVLKEVVGVFGTGIVAVMFMLLGLYLVFNLKFAQVIKTLSFVKDINFAGVLSLLRIKKSSKEDSVEEIEDELFDIEDLDEDDDEDEEEEETDLSPKEDDKKDAEEKEDYTLVESLSEPVSILKSTVSGNKGKSSVSGSDNSKSQKTGDSKNFEKESDGTDSERDSSDEGKGSGSLPFRNNIWEYPPLSILNEIEGGKADTGNTKKRAKTIENTLESFGIKSKVKKINEGPSVTQYALRVAEGTKTTKITNLQGDLAMALASPNGQVRIEAPIPGKSLIGIEVPNVSQEIVYLKSMLQSKEYKKLKEKSGLTLSLGKDVGGKGIYYPLNSMPHVLIAGATGSGKSVMIHSVISTLLFANSPDECKFIMVDPKRVELVNYNGIPHLITPVITETSEAVNALKWVVGEMERRLKVLSDFGVRNIDSYNEKSGFQAMPYIVVILDELADLMMTSSNEVEKQIVRIAQLSRATGIHLVLATQRPSTDIITGSIKANVPARIAFNVASNVDSRVIIDSAGAEKLLGRGDMLFVSPESSKPKRIQGVYVPDEEINRLVKFLKESEMEPDYNEEVTSSGTTSPSGEASWEDDLFPKAVEVTVEYGRGSASLLQRRLSIGYARAARLLDELEENGVVGPKEGSKARDVLIDSPSDVLG